jgi:hypothetical protein
VIHETGTRIFCIPLKDKSQEGYMTRSVLVLTEFLVVLASLSGDDSTGNHFTGGSRLKNGRPFKWPSVRNRQKSNSEWMSRAGRVKGEEPYAAAS